MWWGVVSGIIAGLVMAAVMLSIYLWMNQQRQKIWTVQEDLNQLISDMVKSQQLTSRDSTHEIIQLTKDLILGRDIQHAQLDQQMMQMNNASAKDSLGREMTLLEYLKTLPEDMQDAIRRDGSMNVTPSTYERPSEGGTNEQAMTGQANPVNSTELQEGMKQFLRIPDV